MNIIRTETFLKHIFRLSTGQRYPYAVLLSRETPKGKYSKEKILKNFGFPTLEKAEAYIDTIKQQLSSNENRRVERKQAIKTNNSNLIASQHFKVGDIILNSWGYEQTNVDFFIVEEVLNKKIRVRSIGQSNVEGSMYSHGMACEVVPEPQQLGDKKYLLSLKCDEKGNVWICNPESYYYFHKWDGSPKYKSWYY